MIAFQTLFLGLVFGFGPVQVMVSPPVVSAEVFLDGVSLGTARAAPWEVGCNFGASPLPHELVAVGRDAKGNEVARVRQWVNLPRPSAEARVLVEAGADGAPAFAHLAWHTIDNARPKRFDVTLDGHELPVKDPERIRSPASTSSGRTSSPSRSSSRWGSWRGRNQPRRRRRGQRRDRAHRRCRRPSPRPDAASGRRDAGVVQERGPAAAGRRRRGGPHRRGRRLRPGQRRAVPRHHPAQSVFRRHDDNDPDPGEQGGNRLYGLWAVPQRPQGGGSAAPGLFPMSIPLDTDVDDVRTLISASTSPPPLRGSSSWRTPWRPRGCRPPP